MLLLSTLVATFLTISLTEHKISRNVINSAKALQFADAGVEHSRRVLLLESPSAILDGTAGYGPPGTPPFGLVATLDDGTYSVQITNNDTANGFPRGTILADLQQRSGESAVIRSRVLRTGGDSESGLAERLAERIDQLDTLGNPTLAFQASGIEGIKVRIVTWDWMTGASAFASSYSKNRTGPMPSGRWQVWHRAVKIGSTSS